MLHPSKQSGGVSQPSTQPELPQKGQKTASKAPRRRSSALRFFASNAQSHEEKPAPTQKEWEANYLKNLRTNLPPRPGGSRPLPARNITPEPHLRAASALSFRPLQSTQRPDLATPILQERAASALSQRRAQSTMPGADARQSPNGRAPVQPPHKRRSTRDISAATAASNPSTEKPPLEYRESGMRWMEKQEARSIREALADMDMRNEAKVHAAAQDEASNLVCEHMSLGNQDGSAKPCRNYISHLEEGSHARTQSQGCYAGQNSMDGAVERVPYFASSNNTPSSTLENVSNVTPDILRTAEQKASDGMEAWKPNNHVRWDSPGKKAYTDLAFQTPNLRSARRRSSGNKTRNGSGGPFSNPDDKIYEEVDDRTKCRIPKSIGATRIPTPLTGQAQSSALNVQSTKQRPLPPSKIPVDASNRVHRSEIYRNPPSQSRNPSYVKNNLEQDASSTNDSSKIVETSEMPGTKDGVEVRSDDIREATSMRFRDRSPRLPSPAFVSDQPGRHIVSFDEGWKPRDQDEIRSREVTPAKDRPRFKPSLPASTASAPLVPTINIPDAPSIFVDAPTTEHDQPTISVSEASLPTISLPDERAKKRPLPTRGSQHTPANRPLPHHSSTTPVHTSMKHWTPASHRSTAQCAACALPIAGRIVSAASQRFHPHCFTCHHCAEPLECVAFYPEPQTKREERVARIQDRLNGIDLPDDKAGETAADDGDDSLRFYCHLDFHEMFSPRCRSCKTPIETEVILACGGSWHVGHFFCAECGDPFDAKTPFVEKDGYAWCVGCHAGRFSGKCKGCRKPVVEQGISALGAEWHEKCFVCVECGGDFDDGRFFTRDDEQKPVCVGCEERRLKA